MDDSNSNSGVFESDKIEIGLFVWFHIIIFTLSSVLLLPLNLLCRHSEIWRNRVQFTTLLCILLGSVFGFLEGRKNSKSFHSILGYFLSILCGVYIIISVCYKASEYPFKFCHNKFRATQNVAKLAFAICAYIELALGIITLLGFCAYPHTQQCFGHLGIGSNFLLYFSIWGYLASNDSNRILPAWMRPEVLDAIFILPGGFGLAFFGHVWGYPWDNESIQHVFLGVVSIIGPLLGVWQSIDAYGEPKRNIYPGLVSLIAGYTFLSHPAKHDHILGSLHQGVGLLIAIIGACRIIDVTCVTYFRDRVSKKSIHGPWNMLSSFFGISVGGVIMAANEEQAALFTKYEFDAASVFMGVFAMATMVLAYISAIIYLLEHDGKLKRIEEYTNVELEEC